MSDLRSEMEEQRKRQQELDRQMNETRVRMQREAIIERERRIAKVLNAPREDPPPPPMKIRVNRASEIRTAAERAVEATANLNEDLINRIRRDPELRGRVEAAASAWMLLAQYVAEDS
jgi:hypothetical protein